MNSTVLEVREIYMYPFCYNQRPTTSIITKTIASLEHPILAPHLQLNLLLPQQPIPIHILNRIRPNILQRLLKLLRLLRTIRKQMVLDKFLRRLAEPLEQREVLELVGTENLQHFDVLVVG